MRAVLPRLVAALGAILLAVAAAGPHAACDVPDLYVLEGGGGAGGGSACPPDDAPCGGACVELLTDPAHCGGCDLACAAGEVCSIGVCADMCDAGLIACERGCVDPGSDPDHCGSCGHACAPGEGCVAATCQ